MREPHEYEEANLGGKLYPLGKIQTMQVEELEDLKDEEVIIHCRRRYCPCYPMFGNQVKG